MKKSESEIKKVKKRLLKGLSLIKRGKVDMYSIIDRGDALCWIVADLLCTDWRVIIGRLDCNSCSIYRDHGVVCQEVEFNGVTFLDIMECKDEEIFYRYIDGLAEHLESELDGVGRTDK